MAPVAVTAPTVKVAGVVKATCTGIPLAFRATGLVSVSAVKTSPAVHPEPPEAMTGPYEGSAVLATTEVLTSLLEYCQGASWFEMILILSPMQIEEPSELKSTQVPPSVVAFVPFSTSSVRIAPPNWGAVDQVRLVVETPVVVPETVWNVPVLAPGSAR